MIRNILLGLFAFILIAAFIVWVLNKGPQRAFQSARDFSFVGATTTEGGGFLLPWQPTNSFSYIEEEDLYGAPLPGSGTDAQLEDIQQQYEQIMKDVDAVAQFGEPSPLFRKVMIAPGYSNPGGSLTDEFLVVEAAWGNTGPILLAGWSLQSALTGARVAIPNAANLFVSGAVNTANPVMLAPGASAIVSSGASPVGASFRENACIGYLGQFQSFNPPLTSRCPSPSAELPLTAENLQRYGDACFDVLNSLSSCEFPRQVPTGTSPECRAFLQATLTYNGCVNRHSGSPRFTEDSWRVYLGAGQELWRNSRDVIRLLDAEGRTVDVYTY